MCFRLSNTATCVIEAESTLARVTELSSVSFLQAQCLINVSGDAVVFVRESDLEVVSTQHPTANCQPLCAGGEVTT